jgi:hypothetical protein
LAKALSRRRLCATELDSPSTGSGGDYSGAGCGRGEELESSATEDEIAAEMAVARTTTMAAFTRKRPARKPGSICRVNG